MLGALIITLLYNGCVMLGVDDWVQKVLIGGIIVAAVWVDGVRINLRRMGAGFLLVAPLHRPGVVVAFASL